MRPGFGDSLETAFDRDLSAVSGVGKSLNRGRSDLCSQGPWSPAPRRSTSSSHEGNQIPWRDADCV